MKHFSKDPRLEQQRHPPSGKRNRAAGILDKWYQWAGGQPGLRGGDADVENFANTFGVGDRGKALLRQHLFGEQHTAARRKQSDRLTGPFAGDYEDFEDCEDKNSDKADPAAYCGEIHHQVEKGRKRKGEPLHDFQDKESRRRKQAWTGWAPRQHKVAGWNWDEYLNGFITTAADKFSCDCGQEFDTPGGFHRCACGKQWNSYVIGTGGEGREASLEKVICREVPLRKNVIVANRGKEAADTGQPPNPGGMEGQIVGLLPGSQSPAGQWQNIDERAQTETQTGASGPSGTVPYHDPSDQSPVWRGPGQQLSSRRCRADVGADLDQSVSDEAKAIRDYTDYANDAEEAGRPGVADRYREVRDDEESHEKDFSQLRRDAAFVEFYDPEKGPTEEQRRKAFEEMHGNDPSKWPYHHHPRVPGPKDSAPSDWPNRGRKQEFVEKVFPKKPRKTIRPRQGSGGFGSKGFDPEVRPERKTLTQDEVKAKMRQLQDNEAQRKERHYREHPDERPVGSPNPYGGTL